MKIKDSKYLNINEVNPLYLTINKVNGCSGEIDESKYLTLLPINESIEKIKKYEKLWNKIRYLIKLTTRTSGDYDKKYMKIKFNLDDEIPLTKMIEIPTMLYYNQIEVS